MIRTIGELLSDLIERERAVLSKYKDVQHGPMIGDMYEGLTTKVLNSLVFEGLDLRVVEGKIRNSKGELSRQIDCMVVRGEGDLIPHTTHCIYPYEQVIAIVEVKKNLLSDGLNDALALFGDLWRRIAEPHDMTRRLVRDAWRSIVRTELPSHQEALKLPFDEEMLYHVLMVEASLPLRIVLGYEGYKTESGLRAAFIQYMQGLLQKGGVGGGPQAYPNLIISGTKSLLKLNGMPYGGPRDDEKYWNLVGSRGTRSVYTLVELFWTRLSYGSSELPPDIFGEDLEREGFNRLLRTRPIKSPTGQVGWEFAFDKLRESELSAGSEVVDWEPEFLSLLEFHIMNRLCSQGAVPLDDPYVVRLLQEHGMTVDQLVRSLNSKGLAYGAENRLELLTDGCACVILPDGRYAAGEDKTGRLRRWVTRYSDRTREDKGLTS